MKRVTVADAAGKPLRIALLTDWDLIYGLPYTLLAFGYEIARRLVFAIVSKPARAVAMLFTKLNVSLVWLLATFPLLIAVAAWVTTAAGPFSAADLVSGVALFLVGSALIAKVFIHESYLQDVSRRGKPGAPVSPREDAALSRMRAEAAALPDACVRHRFDKPTLYLSFVKTLLLLPGFVCLIVLPASYLNVALLAYVAVFMFNDFEWIEHVSSHATHARLLVRGRAPWWARVVEPLRRCLIWPLFGWFPDWYFVVHALHHHVENNGPADWQSTIRYDRASFFGFVKYATWTGLNLLVPFETVSYLVQRRGWRFLRLFLRGYCIYLALLALVAATEPLLFAILVAQRVLVGVGGYVFTGRWHGFQHVDHPYDVQSSNHALVHYAHHVKPRVHLLDAVALARVTRQVKAPSTLVILRPEFDGGRGFWSLQALLWKKEFDRAADCFIAYDRVNNEDRASLFQLHRGLSGRGMGGEAMRLRTVGFFPESRPRWLQRVDDTLSNAMGTLVGRALALRFNPALWVHRKMHRAQDQSPRP